jgi:hypothetical protein
MVIGKLPFNLHPTNFNSVNVHDAYEQSVEQAIPCHPSLHGLGFD